MATGAPGPEPEIQQRRLRWRCRRGTKELDVLLERYATRRWGQAEPAERAAFLELLELPDPILIDYLLGSAEVIPQDPALAGVVRCIRATPERVGGATPVRGAAGSPAAAQASSLKGPC